MSERDSHSERSERAGASEKVEPVETTAASSPNPATDRRARRDARNLHANPTTDRRACRDARNLCWDAATTGGRAGAHPAEISTRSISGRRTWEVAR